MVMAGIKWTLRDSTIFSVQFSANIGFKWHNQHAYTEDKKWPDAAIFYRALFLEIVGRMEKLLTQAILQQFLNGFTEDLLLIHAITSP